MSRFSLLPIILLLMVSYAALAATKNGFNLDETLIPVAEIYHGGPAKDGIPAIDRPVFVGVDKAHYLRANDRVLGVVIGDQIKAYPIRILNWHEVINDVVDGKNIVVTFCPLCGTGMVFLAPEGAGPFGVSGLLYNSDVLLYDKQTQSLWSQLRQQSIAGPMIGRDLELIATQHTTWQDWQRRYPQTLVLSSNTGFNRDYSTDPYANYRQTLQLFFPVSSLSNLFHPKENVLAIKYHGAVKAYPFSELAKSPAQFDDELAGERVLVKWDEQNQSASIYNKSGEPLPTTIAFWFAWYAFYPETAIYRAPQ